MHRDHPEQRAGQMAIAQPFLLDGLKEVWPRISWIDDRYSRGSTESVLPTKNSLSVELNGQVIAVELQDDIGPIQTVQLDRHPKPMFAPAHRCIYCGSAEQLSDEHIIPFALSGEDVIRRGSCSTCARETCRFEQLVLRGPMRAARIHRRLKSRTKHAEAADTHRLNMVNSSGEFTVDLPLSGYPILLHFPIFAQPGHATGINSPGIRMQGIHTVLFGPHPEEVAKTHGATEISFPATQEQPTAFARMLAKIAYGYAFANGALSRIDGPSPVIPCIRGLVDDVGQWVFTAQGDIVAYPGVLHRVQMHDMDNLLIAEVQLFADSQTPKYGVILGRLKNQG